MYGNVLGAATTAGAVIVLPNTGSNRIMAIVATIALVVGVTILATSAARVVAKRVYKG